MIIQIFYPEQLVKLNLSEAIEWHFESDDYINCLKENADRLIVTFPKRMAGNSNFEIGGSPELYWSPYATTSNGSSIPEAYVTEETWNRL